MRRFSRFLEVPVNSAKPCRAGSEDLRVGIIDVYGCITSRSAPPTRPFVSGKVTR
jgi:hypothetical protein